MAQSKSAAQKVADMLKKADLTDDDRHLLITCILDKFSALPLRDIITADNQGSLVIRGKPVDLDQAKKLCESAKLVLNNSAFTLICDEVLFQAITNGFLRMDSERESLFNRAAVWFGKRQRELLELLAQSGAPVIEE